MGFEQWEALAAFGATLDEVYKWEQGEYPRWFQAKLIAWYRGHLMVENHTQDAVAAKMESERKKK